MSKPKKAKSKNHEIIGRFISPESSKGDKYFWPREMKLAGQLLKKYPLEFYLVCKEPFYPLKMNSLAWFISKEGELFLANQFFQFSKEKTDLTPEKTEIVLTPDKIGEDIQNSKKPKSLKDFLKI